MQDTRQASGRRNPVPPGDVLVHLGERGGKPRAQAPRGAEGLAEQRVGGGGTAGHGQGLRDVLF